MERKELDLVTDEVEALEDLAKAKKAYAAKKTDATKAELDATKFALYKLRAHWRGIREVVTGAAVPTVSTKARSN